MTNVITFYGVLGGVRRVVRSGIVYITCPDTRDRISRYHTVTKGRDRVSILVVLWCNTRPDIPPLGPNRLKESFS